MPDAAPRDEMLTPGEVAALFRVDPKTVARWSKQGKLTYTRTLGGHRRFPRADVIAQYEELMHRRQAG